MSESFLPPVMVELGGSDDGFIKTLTRATTALERFAESARVSAAAVEGSFAQLAASFKSLAPAIETVNAAKKELQGFSRSANAVAKATDKAAAATDKAMASIAASAKTMGEAVSTSAAAAETGMAAIGAEAKATATGLKVTADESVVAGTKMKAAGAEAEAAGGKFLGLGPVFDKVKKWGVIGLAGIGIASVDLASKFQTEMTRLSTAAGAPAAQVKAMRGQVLATADAVGVSGTRMAEALYHPVSAGLDLKTALQAVKYAAEEAKISGASLEDTTYSLSSVMKAFNQPASQAESTMASLNAIVGQGDMRFQDFNQSVKNWAPTASQMGISINSMGAGLAYLTDRGNSAEVAATRMTMGISMMTTPSAKATAMLKGLGLASTDVSASSAAMKQAMEKAGITQNKLAMDLKRPDGLYVALNDLKTSLEKAGVSGTQADSVLSKIFGGGRSDKAIMSLMQNLDGLKTKFEDIQKASNTKNFDAAWEKTQQTFSAQMGRLKAAAENTGISIGNALLPSVTGLVKGITNVVTAVGPFINQHKQLVGLIASLAGGLLAGAIALKAWAVAQAAVNAVMAVFDAEADANPIGAIVMAIAALVAGLIYAYNHFAKFRAVVNDVGRFLMGAFKVAWQQAAVVVRGLEIAWSATVHAMQALARWLDANVLSWVKARMADLSAWWKLHGAQIEAIAKAVFAAIGLYAKAWWATMQPLLAVLAAAWRDTWGVLRDTARVAWSVISGVTTTAMHLILNTVGLVLDLITGKWSRVWSDLKQLVGQQLHDVASTISSVGSGFANLLYNAGASVIHGLISGIESAMGGLGSTLSSITSFITSHKGPPSYDRVMLAPAGRMIMQGLVDGLNSHLPVLAAATANVGATVESSFAQRMGIASPSKVFRTLGIYLNEGLIDGMTGSTAKVKAATKRIESLLMETYNKVSDLRGTRGVSNRWVAAHEATLKHLESYAGREDRLMRSLAAKRDSVAKRIKDAQKALAAVQKQWNAEVKTVADGVMQGFSIVTQAPQEGFALSAQDVVNNMQAQYQKAQEFAAELQTLQKKGLSSTLIQQLAAAGVDQGGATAAALAGASKGQIKQLNSLQSATQNAANGVGVAVADSMYGAGLKSAQGLVKGLQSQEKAIEAQMMRIAKSMQKAIKSALGIRSPSRVFTEIGTWIPKGLAKGVDGSAHHATDAVNRLAGAMTSTGARGGAGLAMAGGGTTVVNQYTVNVTVEGSVRSDRDLRDVVEQQMLRLGMRNPATYPSYRR
ncbi:phage tail tape measure protein [Streptomyces sp. NPDC006739]|uniref:phage tail tape measure protein n=1 Tax=Streptomyces sp. NPDC006739 TaxID=3364763 RepID=UPI0036CA25B3